MISNAAPESIWIPWPTEGHVIRAWQSKSFEGGTKYVRDDLAVRVKPLEWEYHPVGAMAADTVGISYIIDTRGSDRPRFLKWPGAFAPDVETLESAKAAAQADYEERILSALEFIAPPAAGGAE